MFRRFYYGWVIVGVAWVALFAGSAGAPPVFTVFVTPMSNELGWSRTLMSGAVSVATLATIPVLPLMGRWLDSYGARRVIAIGGLVMGGALLSLAWVRGIWGFYISYGLSRMMSQGVIRMASTTAVSNWFIRRRGRAQAIINVGRGAGAAVMPLIAFFIMRIYGWRVSWLAIGAMVLLILVVPAALFLRRRPEDIGLRPDGLPPVGSPAAAASPAHPTTVAPEPEWTLREALKTTSMWLITGALFIRGMAAPGVGIHLMPYLLDQGLDPTISAVIVSLNAISLSAGGMIWGLLGERLRVSYLLVATSTFSAVALGVLLLTHTVPMALAYAVMNGLALGGTFTLEVVIWADYFGRKSLGTIQGFAMPLSQVGLALGPLASGLSYDLTGSYNTAFTVFLFAYLLDAVMLLLAKPPRKAAYSR